MSFPKILAIFSIFLFGVLGITALIKTGRGKDATEQVESIQMAPLEIDLDQAIETQPTPIETPSAVQSEKIPLQLQPPSEQIVPPSRAATTSTPSAQALPEANRIQELFVKDSKLPIVQTITYKSRVAWQKGRPAWLSDYAAHYQTSRHFIARSLNGKPDYFKMDVADGNRFNVFRQDKKFEFYLVVDASLLKMWFFYHDQDENQLVLLKTYKVGLGRPDSSKASGTLTPLGKYRLGDKVAIYKPNVKGFHKGENVEMIRVFGTRWIPFEKELEGATEPAKGYGIHGTPWVKKADGTLAEDLSSLGRNDSDGCVRLNTNDMEEIFAVVITKPTTIEIVKNFNDAKLPAQIK